LWIERLRSDTKTATALSELTERVELSREGLPIVGGMITSTVHVLILMPVFFAIMKERAWRHSTLIDSTRAQTEPSG